MLNRNVAADMFPVPFPAEFQKTKDHNPEQNQKMEHEFQWQAQYMGW